PLSIVPHQYFTFALPALKKIPLSSTCVHGSDTVAEHRLSRYIARLLLRRHAIGDVAAADRAGRACYRKKESYGGSMMRLAAVQKPAAVLVALLVLLTPLLTFA